MFSEVINQVAFPASACYDEDTREWRFADELDGMSNSHFATVVKIKSLLSLVNKQEDEEVERKNIEYYKEEHYFPKFCFPERQRMRGDFAYLVDHKLVFKAKGHTPQSVCEEFFVHIRKNIKKSVEELSEQTGIKFAPLKKIAIVHPPKQGEAYVEELVRLVKAAFGCAPAKVLTSTQALGLLAFHQGLLGNGEKVLFFDMGDETISVTKAWVNEIGRNVKGDFASKKVGILIDSPEGHSKPIDIGGSDIDENIASYLETCIHDRETVGSPSVGEAGHIYENGLCASQYLLMKDIKKAKMVMPLTVGGIFQYGVPISIHRETLVQRLFTPEEFYSCVGIAGGKEGEEADESAKGVAAGILEYIFKEMALPVNRDVTKILFAGGLIESFGLLGFLAEQINKSYPHIKVLKFENDCNDGNNFSIQFFESSTYASALGGAIVAMKNYSVDAVLCCSYGTWLYSDNNKKHLKLFANRGDVLLEDENRFAMVAAMDVGRKEQVFLEGDELFSTVISMEEMKRCAYRDTVTYDDEWLIVGEEGDPDRKRAQEGIDLRVVAGGKGTEIHFYYDDDRVAVSATNQKEIYFEEGFVVDKKGLAKPFFSNLREKNNTPVKIRSLKRNTSKQVSASDIEFRMHMSEIMVTTSN